MRGLTLSEFWKEDKIAYKERCAKRNNKYEPLIISIGAVKKAEAIYELGEWFIYPTKGFVMNKKNTRKRMQIDRFIKKLKEEQCQ